MTRKRKHSGIRKYLLWGSLALALILLAAFLSARSTPKDIIKASQRTSKALERRMNSLESQIKIALEDSEGWIGSLALPEDMVIYRYVEDTLQSWCNQFPVKNDDITGKVVIQRLSRPRESISSPLAEVRQEPSLVNYGTKWYLVKAESKGTVKVIAGLEIMDTMDEENSGGINPRLTPGRGYSIVPISENGGAVIRLAGQPVFRVVAESASGPGNFVGPALFSKLFSPTVYADGQLFNSLGTVIIVSLVIFVGICVLFFLRKRILRQVLKSAHPKAATLAHAISLMVLLIGIILFIHFIFRSIILNSSITLELYRLNDLSIYSLLVYLTMLLLLMTIPLLGVMLSPLVKKLFGVKVDPISGASRIVMAVLFSAYLVATAGVLGFRKERDRVNVLANRLSMERNISLELQLRLMEEKIASDQLIATLAALPNSNNIILNRIVESYMVGLSQDNDIVVELFPENEQNPAAIAYFTRMVSGGTAIADGTRFRYRRDNGGNSYYTGNFAYYNQGSGVTMMLLTVSPKSNREDRGYARILGYSAPGDVLLPARYSYAKYTSDKLMSYKGNYAYPTLLDERRKEDLLLSDGGFVRVNGFIHFINNVSDEDLILVSREKTENFYYFVAFLFLTLVLYLCLTFISLFKVRRKTREKNYYKSRINAAMMVALVMTLIALATVSVLFVYRRNNANLRYSMADKTNSIQTLLEARCRFAQDYTDLNTQEAVAMLEDVSNTMKCDITLYTTSGKEFRSTTPEVFDRMLLGTRMNQDAFENIIYKNRRYYIGEESIGRNQTYFLYAPLFNSQGNMVAIMAAPFTDESFDFKSEAVLHSITIVTVFLILLLLARLLMERAVDKMFKPITEVGQKMNEVDINNLEYIVYERDDEVSTLVRAYNLMVHDLYNSTKQLTQAERDKAWATMARQVAHEIKNPLTPIKLQIQRLIRMKSKGDPAWVDRFDEISKEVLGHIDILAETANEFSTFAKLYSEEPVEIDLDKLLKEQIDIFDSREDITFSYMGLEGARVMGPKPQLIRVFVNLISNSVQAIENARNEMREKGNEPFHGEVLISLRLSNKEGFYDIVFEDNGPGVSDEHRPMLFTPNFTTKSNGTGLGLSICRNIVEKCDGEIFYSKSFSLKGACFTVRFPKKKN
jgi:nitrogen fixation/metabolism regulation signal transduction histidine kinase